MTTKKKIVTFVSPAESEPVEVEVLDGDPKDEGRLKVDLDGSEVFVDHQGTQMVGAAYWTA